MSHKTEEIRKPDVYIYSRDGRITADPNNTNQNPDIEKMDLFEILNHYRLSDNYT